VYRVRTGAILLAIVLVAAACGPEADISTSVPGTTTDSQTAPDGEWVLEIKDGDSYSFEDRFWETRLVASEDGILVVGELDTGQRTQLLHTWFRDSGGDWIEGEITPQGGATDFEPWIVTATPEGFLIAGINSSGQVEGDGEGEGEREVAPLVGDGTSWTLTEMSDTGITSLVSQVMEPMCLCAFIFSVTPFGDGYLAPGSIPDNKAGMWHSTDGQGWTPVEIGPTDYRGMVAVATLDDVAYAFGAAPNPGVWSSTDGETWELVADAAALGLDADSKDKVDTLGMVADDGRLYALVALDLPFGDEVCPPPIEECDTPTLVLLTSDDGANWERVPLTEAIRWIDRTASIASYDRRVYIGTDSNDQLLVWSVDDPTAVVVPPPDEQPSPEREPFVAVKVQPDWYYSEVPVHILLEPYTVLLDDLGPLAIQLTYQDDEETTHVELSDGYVIEGDAITATSEPHLVTFADGDTFEFTIEVAGPLDAGMHVYEVEVPVWVGGGDPKGRDPDQISTVTFTYNVFDEERIAETRGFCDVVLRFQGGPDSASDLDVFDELAAEYLEGDLLERAETASAELRAAIESGDFDTSEIVGVIGDACGRYDLESVRVIYD
jgi:hypothetical protein